MTTATAGRPWTDPALPTSARVDSLLAELTLAEKVAQLSSAWEDVEPAGPEVAPGTNLFGSVGALDETARDGIGQLTRPYVHIVGQTRVVATPRRHRVPVTIHQIQATGTDS